MLAPISFTLSLSEMRFVARKASTPCLKVSKLAARVQSVPAGLVLFARGSRVVPAVTLVMLAQAETVAAPVWTYLFFDETTTPAVILGGALILFAVLIQASDGARQKVGHAAPNTSR